MYLAYLYIISNPFITIVNTVPIELSINIIKAESFLVIPTIFLIAFYILYLARPLTTLRIKLKLLRHFIQRSNRIIPILIFPHTPYQRRCQKFKDIFNFIQIRIYRKSLVISHGSINLTGSKDAFCHFVFAFIYKAPHNCIYQ